MKMMSKRLSLAAGLLGAAVYILVPTPDEAVIHPAVSGALYIYFQVDPLTGILVSVAVYRLADLACLAGALLLGEKDALWMMREKLRVGVGAPAGI